MGGIFSSTSSSSNSQITPTPSTAEKAEADRAAAAAEVAAKEAAKTAEKAKADKAAADAAAAAAVTATEKAEAEKAAAAASAADKAAATAKIEADRAAAAAKAEAVKSTATPETIHVQVQLKSTVGSHVYYGTVKNLQLAMSTEASEASKFKLVSVDSLKSEVRSQHLDVKYALIWEGKKDAASPVSSWYVSATLTCLPYDSTTWTKIKASTTVPLPLGVQSDKVFCAKLVVPKLLSCGESKAAYLVANPDVARAKKTPWEHYVASGKKEGRAWPGTLCVGTTPPAPGKIDVATPPAVCPTTGSDILITTVPKPLGLASSTIAGISIGTLVAAIALGVAGYYGYQYYKQKKQSTAKPLNTQRLKYY